MSLVPRYVVRMWYSKTNRLISTSRLLKTDPFQAGSVIWLASNNSGLCPFRALQQYMVVHPSNTGPLFVFQCCKYLMRKDISNSLRQLLPNNQGLSSHSFRIGAASTAASVGHPGWLIQSQSVGGSLVVMVIPSGNLGMYGWGGSQDM